MVVSTRNINTSARLVLWLVLAGIAAGVLYVIVSRWTSPSIPVYTESYVILDSTAAGTTYISFVAVNMLDSASVLTVAQDIARRVIEGPELASGGRRSVLIHLSMPSDTQKLTQRMVEEIAYSHPHIANPAEGLYYVSDGWVVASSFRSEQKQPSSLVVRRTEFYRPRPGFNSGVLNLE